MRNNHKEGFVRWIQRMASIVTIPLKWRSDLECLPLTREHYELYRNIHLHCLKMLGDFPDLKRCPGFNDKIQWLKLFDQRVELPVCSDKLKVRHFVAARIGEGYSPVVYQVASKFDDIDFESLPVAFVLKTNHDSGSVVLVRDKATLDRQHARCLFERALAKSYGWEKGEWAYRLIEPRIYAEEFLGPEELMPPADYKFHCVNGKVRWLQYISGRGKALEEVIVDPAGNVMHVALSHNMKSVNYFTRPAEWEKLVTIAQSLSAGFRYVRVDLYLTGGRIAVGEMTFFPKSGCYLGEGQLQLGQLLDFDRADANPLYCAE